MIHAQVAINSSYAALVLGVCVIVGFATGLDPQVRPVAAFRNVARCYLASAYNMQCL